VPDLRRSRAAGAIAALAAAVLTAGPVWASGSASTEAGTAAALYIDFAGQCAGEGPGNGHIGRGQVWQYRAGQLASAGTGACAGPGRTVAPGAPVVRRPCSSPGPAGARWSIGYSAVTAAPGPGGGRPAARSPPR
jgi:hypothetical protein